MENWKSYYESHMMSFEDAAKLIESGDRMWVGATFSVPMGLLNALADRYEELENVMILSNMFPGMPKFWTDEKYRKAFRSVSYFPNKAERMAFDKGLLEYGSIPYGYIADSVCKLSQAPHLLTAPEPQQTEPNLEAVRLQNELTLALNRGSESPEYIKSLVLTAAVQRYNQIPDPTPAHKLERLRIRLEQGPADADVLSALLTTAVRTVRLDPDKTVALELVNGTIITEEKEESA